MDLSGIRNSTLKCFVVECKTTEKEDSPVRMGFCPSQRALARLWMQYCIESIVGRRDEACLQHQLWLLITGEGLTPQTELIRQRKLHSSSSSSSGEKSQSRFLKAAGERQAPHSHCPGRGKATKYTLNPPGFRVYTP